LWRNCEEGEINVLKRQGKQEKWNEEGRHKEGMKGKRN
jgi:hypothetical protein